MTLEAAEAKRHNYASTVNIIVTNNSDVVLEEKRTYNKGGDRVINLIDVQPGGCEAVLMARNHRGNHGTLAYGIGDSGYTLIIMWTSSLNSDHFANIMAIGVTTELNTDKFSTMYFENHSWFRRKNFYFNDDQLVVDFDRFQICADMKIHPQSDINVIFSLLPQKN